MVLTKNNLDANKAVVKHRSKKEQTEMAANRMRVTGIEASKKQINAMLERDKKREADKRKKISNRAK